MSFRTNPKAKSVPIKENRRKTKNFPPIFCVAFSTWFLILPGLYGLVLVDRGALDGLFLSSLLGGAGCSLSQFTPFSSNEDARNSRPPYPSESFGPHSWSP
jgi:hypothetical protein